MPDRQAGKNEQTRVALHEALQALSPAWCFTIIVGSFIASHLLFLSLTFILPPMPLMIDAVVDLAVDLLFLIPVVIFFVCKPLGQQIASRQRTAEQLRLREENFRTLAENSRDVIVRFDRDLRCLYVNPAGAGIIGVPAAVFVGRRCREMGGGFAAPVWEEKLRQVLESMANSTFEVTMTAAGRELVVEAVLTPETAPDGTIATILAVARDITEHRRVEMELRDQEKQLRALAAHLQQAREDERSRVAQEVHEELGQVLAAVRMNLSLLGQEFALPALQERVDSLGDELERAIGFIRRLASQLRPFMLDMFGLTDAIEWQCSEISKESGVLCRCAVVLHRRRFNPKVETAVFRIFHEAVTNATRRARATQVSVTLERRNEWLVLTVRDNGAGRVCDKADGGTSLGIVGMKERGHALGGRVRIFGGSGRGTSIVAHIPVNPRGENQDEQHEENSYSR